MKSLLIAVLLIISTGFIEKVKANDHVHAKYNKGVDINTVKLDWNKTSKKHQTASDCNQNKTTAGTNYAAVLQQLSVHRYTIISDSGVFAHYYCGGDCVDWCYTIVYDDGTSLSNSPSK